MPTAKVVHMGFRSIFRVQEAIWVENLRLMVDSFVVRHPPLVDAFDYVFKNNA